MHSAHSSLSFFVKGTASTSFGLAVRYAMFAGLAWLLGYVIFRRRWFHRKIIASFPQRHDVWREIGYSALSAIVFAVVATGAVYAARHGWTQLYRRVDQHGWWWFSASLPAAILLHDTYFYWTHRLMHHRRLFRYFHRVHHLSHNPTPWAAYAFHPLEAVVQAGIFPLAMMVMPMHPAAFFLFTIWQLVFNVAGHTGYEYNPRGFMDCWLKFILNTPTNHVMHHEKMRGNYGLYFSFWDRLMGTHHPDYETRFREVTSRNPTAAKATELPQGPNAGEKAGAESPSAR